MVMLLGFTLPAAAATWTTETVPAGPGALGPARLSFDAQGRALFLWDGVPAASQPRFTGMAARGPGGGWTRLANLPDVGWGNGPGAAVRHHACAVRERPGRLRWRVQPRGCASTSPTAARTAAAWEAGGRLHRTRPGSSRRRTTRVRRSSSSTPAATVCRRSIDPRAVGS